MSIYCGENEDYSFFDGRTVKEIYNEIKKVYIEQKKPWVIGYSGGKDSSTALQLIWYAIRELEPEKRKYPIYVISSDTLVETPPITKYINQTMKKINILAKETQLPFEANIVNPLINDTFWVNLLGRGYPAPTIRFRWCTDRMKIDPANRFIEEKISAHGDVIIVLGVRRGESMTRDQVMSLHRIEGSLLSIHTYFKKAFVYTPIENFTIDDVWEYLLKYESPWGDNRALFEMYRNSTAGECPLIVDDKIPSCGNSRFGCWVCTVVSEDKTMKELVKQGEKWMKPLLDFRNKLAVTQDPEKKHIYRSQKRRDGKVIERVREDNDKRKPWIPGPYKFEVRKNFLKDLLLKQELMRKEGPDKNILLIQNAELKEIQKIWLREEGDWQKTVFKIYEEITGHKLQVPVDDLFIFTEKEEQLIEEICEAHRVNSQLVKSLLTCSS